MWVFAADDESTVPVVAAPEASVPTTTPATLPTEGPHQGFLQAIDSYYVEIVEQKRGVFHVYLLDKEMKNPLVKNSSVGIFIKSGNVESELTCNPQQEGFFECTQTGKIFKKGEIAVSAKRDNVRSEEFKLKIPLSK
jgi:hypothetical protein